MEAPYVSDRAADLPRSLWAAVTPEAPARPPLNCDHSYDVAIVGAGFMGLSAALHVAGSGARVGVLEAARIGWGASGRNNGLVAPGLKRDPADVRRILGDERAERLLRLAGDAPGELFALIEDHSIECDANNRGWIQAAHSPSAVAEIECRVRDWRDLGADVSMISSDELGARLGTDFYFGASIDRRGGSLNPLAYARGLARAALEAGTDLFEGTPVSGIDRAGSRWKLATPGGSILAEAVLCCTNAYNREIAELNAAVLPLRTAQVASAPLAEKQWRSILPHGESASDTQRLLTSFRITADKRLVMGGASATAGDEHRGLMRHLHRAARNRFPQLGDIDWQFFWSGYLALTHDHLPQIFKLADNFYAGIACNGRGIAMATATGRQLAEIVLTGSEQECELPITGTKRVFGYSFRHPGVFAGVLLNRFLDRAGRRQVKTV
jgi:glycine/D-amino acid oxidase-like deaminating enzyme